MTVKLKYIFIKFKKMSGSGTTCWSCRRVYGCGLIQGCQSDTTDCQVCNGSFCENCFVAHFHMCSQSQAERRHKEMMEQLAQQHQEMMELLRQQNRNNS